jgi:hypothetical protein
LEEEKIIENLMKKYLFSEESILTSFLLKFLIDAINLIEDKSKINTIFKNVNKSMTNYLLNNIKEANDNSIDSICLLSNLISNSPKILEIVLEDEYKLLKYYNSLIKSERNEVLVCYLYSYSIILKSNILSSDEKYSIFSLLLKEEQNLIAVLLSCLKQPYNDVRYSAFSFLYGMSFNEWGVLIFTKYTKFLEYLMDRRTEYEKEGKEWKFAIIDQIHKVSKSNKSIQEEFGLKEYKNFKSYLLRGPFDVDSETQVLVETQNE